MVFMQITSQSCQASVYLNELEKCISDIPTYFVHDFKNKLLGVIFYDNCHSMAEVAVKNWLEYFSRCNVQQEKLVKLGGVIKQLRDYVYKIPHQQESSLDFQALRVRLKGQEVLHFQGQRCTSASYKDDDGTSFCILDNVSPHTLSFQQPSQRYGYQEISFNPLKSEALYTLRLGPCIAILMVGCRGDGTVKAALMHEDYSRPENSVTDMFTHSFQSELKDFKEIKIFLVGGNGGGAYTRNRFACHRSEISQLHIQYGNLITFNLSTDNLDSPDDLYQWDESNVFFTSIESSFYLWILQSSPSRCSAETICIGGPNLRFESLVLYYRERILPLLRPSQIEFQSFIKDTF